MSNNEQLTAYKAPASLVEVRMNQRLYPRLCQYPHDAAIAELVKIVTTAFLYTGREVDPRNINFIATNLYDNIMAEDKHGARNITLYELNRAVKKAVLSGEMYGISVATLYKAVMDYAKGEGAVANEQAAEKAKHERRMMLEKSGVSAMLTAYTGEFLNKQ